MITDTQKTRKLKLIAQLRTDGVWDDRVLAAIQRVPRESFVLPDQVARAYNNDALPIEHGQTISQPIIVAKMVQAACIKPTDRVLEIGTGSGYGAAVLSLLAHEVISVEIVPQLADQARERLRALCFNNVRVITGDGSLGWPEGAPYDVIVVTAAAPELSDQLIDQVSPRGGRLVAPVGSLSEQRLIVATRELSSIQTKELGAVRFVPLVGDRGFYKANANREFEAR